MVPLDNKYQDQLDSIKQNIQKSDILANYLEEEDEAYYNSLKDTFEPALEKLHQEVITNDPLQIIAFEEQLFDPALEGLFLPRILGYSVLRGALNDDYKYIKPQEHFKNILLAIVNSSNFEQLSQRIGQTIEVGFSLSSDIWITNLIASISNRTVKNYLQSHKLLKYRDIRSRHTAYLKYKNQFRNFNYLTTNLPVSAADLKIEFKSIVNFLLYRGSIEGGKSQSVYEFISALLQDPKLGPSDEHLEIIIAIGFYFDLNEAENNLLVERINEYNKDGDETRFFSVVRTLQNTSYGLSDEHYIRFVAIVDQTKLNGLKSFLKVIGEVIKIGYINPEAIETVRIYYNQNKGLSIENECIRNFILKKFRIFMSSLVESDFADYFELNKTFIVYMNIFSNEKFNQDVKSMSMVYVKKLLRTYTVKRSKDYQDIKKFVSATFIDLGFLNEKEVRELFKTKRKKSVA